MGLQAPLLVARLQRLHGRHEQRRDLQRSQPFRLRASRRKGAVLDRVGQGLAEHFALPGVQVGRRGRRDVEPRSIAVLSRPIQY